MRRAPLPVHDTQLTIGARIMGRDMSLTANLEPAGLQDSGIGYFHIFERVLSDDEQRVFQYSNTNFAAKGCSNADGGFSKPAFAREVSDQKCVHWSCVQGRMDIWMDGRVTGIQADWQTKQTE